MPKVAEGWAVFASPGPRWVGLPVCVDHVGGRLRAGAHHRGLERGLEGESAAGFRSFSQCLGCTGTWDCNKVQSGVEERAL